MLAKNYIKIMSIITDYQISFGIKKIHNTDLNSYLRLDHL